MADEIISRAEALARGLSRYFTGKPCKHGHISQRKTSDGHCAACSIERSHAPSQRDRHRRNMKNARDRNPRKYKEIADRCVDKYRLRDLEKNRKYHRLYQVEWVKRNLEKKQTLGREWRRRNPEATRVIKSRRRAREVEAQGSHTPHDLKQILMLQKGRCVYCKIKFGKNVKPSLDHIMALSRGGSNDRTNLQFLCVRCNSSKRDRDHIDFVRSQGMLI